LQRFLEHRPIWARRPTLRERVAKWALRHKPVVASATVVVFLALAGMAATTLLLARQEAETQRQRHKAELNFGHALTGMRELLTELEDRGRDGLSVRQFRQEKVLKGIEILEGFLGEETNDPASRFERARTYKLIAIAHMQWARAERSTEAMHKAF